MKKALRETQTLRARWLCSRPKVRTPPAPRYPQTGTGKDQHRTASLFYGRESAKVDWRDMESGLETTSALLLDFGL